MSGKVSKARPLLVPCVETGDGGHQAGGSLSRLPQQVDHYSRPSGPVKVVKILPFLELVVEQLDVVNHDAAPHGHS
jgi:hypothetical protein